MLVSSDLCIAQEALQRERAAAAILPNGRMIALGAATAWHSEGLAAERREERQTRIRLFGMRHAGAIESPDLLLLSENPDRGRADG